MCRILQLTAVFIIFVYISSTELTNVLDQRQYRVFSELNGLLKLHREPLNWKDASDICHREGGVLASPINEILRTSLQWIMNEMQGDQNNAIFTGMTVNKFYEYFIDGRPASNPTISRASVQLSNESCLLLHREGQMSDVSCEEQYPYVCYKELKSICQRPDPEYRFDSRTGSSYKFHSEKRTWINATLTCAAEHAHLVIINTATEAKVLKEILDVHSDASHIFVGLARWSEGGIWHTLEGQTAEEAGFDSWIMEEDRNAMMTHNCGGMQRGKDTRLFSLMCSYPNRFVCEINN